MNIQWIGVDFGGTTTKVWKTETEQILRKPSFANCSEVDILKWLKDYISQYESIKGVGIALPCDMVGRSENRRISPHSTKFAQLTKSRHKGIISELEYTWERELGHVMVRILNDGEAIAVDLVKTIENSKKMSHSAHAAVIVIGSSIGVGYVFNGEALRGPYTNRASHIVLEPTGSQCPGKTHKGCWKTIVGLEARKQLSLDFQLTNSEEGPLELFEIEKRALNGNNKAKSFIDEYAKRIARGASMIASVVPVDCIVFSGGGIGKSDPFWSHLESYFNEAFLHNKEEAISVDLIRGLDLSVARGAMRLAMQSMYNKQGNK